MNAQVSTTNRPADQTGVVLTDGTAVPASLKQLAFKKVEKAWGEFGEILKLQERIAARTKVISLMILDIAKECVNSVDPAKFSQYTDWKPEARFKLAHARFGALIKECEVHIRQIHGQDEELVKAFWNATLKQYVSNLNGAIKDNIDVRDFETEAALREARKAMKDAKNSNTKNRQTDKDKDDSPAAIVKGDVAHVAKASAKVQQAIVRLLNAIKGADVELFEDDIAIELGRAATVIEDKYGRELEESDDEGGPSHAEAA